MTKIVANIVGRNEAKNYLPQVLERLSHQVDLICFTDDCSDDNTAAIAAKYAQVQHMDKPTFAVNEGQLRQASWDFLEEQLGPDRFANDDIWILAIDCDEELYETKYSLRQLASQMAFDVINIEFYHMWNETQFRIDKAWQPHPSTRYFRYFPGGKFQERQLACGSEPTYVVEHYRQGRYFGGSGLKMKHLSYIKDLDKHGKYERYSKIDGGNFHANSHIESILDPNPTLVDWSFTDESFA